jgi:hypothetical protein
MISKNNFYMNSKTFKEINGDEVEGYDLNASYNGNKGKIDLNIMKNGKTKHYKMSLNNLKFNKDDKEKMKELQNDVLNYNAIETPLELRLLKDFNLNNSNYNYPLILSISKSKLKSSKSKSKSKYKSSFKKNKKK